MRHLSKKNRGRQPSGKGRDPISTGSFRIIGGEWRSRRLQFPGVEGLRPSTDRVRETVFNWLNYELPGARVLDLFAGSGALGFEALSRGAKHCQFIELNQIAWRALQNNIELLGAPAQLGNQDALAYLNGRDGEAFDIVFVDPPFRKNLVGPVVGLLDANALVKPGSVIYVELESELQNITVPKHWNLTKEKTAGQVSYRLYKVGEPEGDRDEVLNA